MRYDHVSIQPDLVPPAAHPLFQHLVDTYTSETNKTASAWRPFSDDDLAWKPHPRSASVGEILRHQILSERRFFAEFLAHDEPAAEGSLLAVPTVAAMTGRFIELAVPRLGWLASLTQEQWLEKRPFFDEERERIWIFWRRVLHSAHHRTQLTVYLRLLNKTVVPTYGPTADVTWTGATPTL